MQSSIKLKAYWIVKKSDKKLKVFARILLTRGDLNRRAKEAAFLVKFSHMPLIILCFHIDEEIRRSLNLVAIALLL